MRGRPPSTCSPPTPPAGAGEAPPWLGPYVEPQTGLSARLDMTPEGRVRLRYGHWPEVFDLHADGSATSPSGSRLRPQADGLRLDRPNENQTSVLRPAPEGASPDVAGVYRCEALGAELTVADAGGALFAAFSGFLGQSRMEQLEPIAADLWALPCWRALDHTPPGDWTLAFHRAGPRAPTRVEVGCWLARGLVYDRQA
jgi:D-aminopeptidase